MWQWLFILIPCLHPVIAETNSFGAPTSIGPVSETERETLWKQAIQAMDESRYQDATHFLERIVDRYPGSPHSIKAQFLLGKALVELGRSEAALAPLKHAVTASHPTVDSVSGRVYLARAYLHLKKFHEAYLTTLEVDAINKAKPIPGELLTQILLIKAQALLELNQDARASMALDSAEKLTEQFQINSQIGPLTSLRLQAKLRECSQIPKARSLSEGQVRDQLNQRGTCLLEGLLLYRKILQSGDIQQIGLQGPKISEAFQKYRTASLNPPLPEKFSKLRKKSLQAKRYQDELVDLLLKEYQKTVSSAVESLNQWRIEAPKETLTWVAQVADALEKTKGKN